MEEQGEVAEPSAEEVEQVLRSVAERVVQELLSGGVPLTPEALTERVHQALSHEEAGRVLFTTAWAEGFQEALRERAEAGEPRGSWGDPRWMDVPGLGERKARYREENLCGRCAHATVCAVARAAPSELLLVVSRCLFFVEPSK